MAVHPWVSKVMFCCGFVVGFCLSFMGICHLRKFHVAPWCQHLAEWCGAPAERPASFLARPVTVPNAAPSIPSRWLLCWLLTTPETPWSRVILIRSTRGHCCDTLLFFDSAPNPDTPGTVLSLKISEGRGKLCCKAMAAVITLHNRSLQQADRFFRAADDTLVVGQNLRKLLSWLQVGQPVHSARQFQRYIGKGPMSGCVGYILSREVAQRYMEALRNDTCGHDSPKEVSNLGRYLERMDIIARDIQDRTGA